MEKRKRILLVDANLPIGLGGGAPDRDGHKAESAAANRRPYKEIFPTEDALQIMREGRTTHFDPGGLDVFFDNLDDVLAIKENY